LQGNKSCSIDWTQSNFHDIYYFVIIVTYLAYSCIKFNADDIN